MDTSAEENAGEDEAVCRPKDQLLDYPIDLRWALTRRHPYYVGLWEEVRRYYRNPPGDPPERRGWGYAAKTLLGTIGVFGEPVSPGTDFQELIGPDSDPSFLCGSLQPMTFRAQTALFLGQLNPCSLGVVGAIFSASAEIARDPALSSADRKKAQLQLLNQLQTMPDPPLDRVANNPLFLMHLGASQASIVDDANDQARRWKAKLGVGTKKIHTAKIDAYLEVWDALEGWNGSGYTEGHWVRLKEICGRLKEPKSTVYSRYRLAFECIIGVPFRPDLWWQLLGPLKFKAVGADLVQALAGARYRRLFHTVRKDVPVTKLLGKRRKGQDDGDGRNSSSGSNFKSGRRLSPTESILSSGDEGMHERFAEIVALLARGFTDGQIESELEIQDKTLIPHIRDKEGELRALFGAKG